MFRFLLSILILGAVIYGIFSFWNPLNQLAKSGEKTPSDYETLLAEALQRNNPNATEKDGNSQQTEDAQNTETGDETPDTQGTDTGNTTRLGNKAFSYESYYRDSNDLRQNNTIRNKNNQASQEQLQARETQDSGRTNTQNLYQKKSGAQGYYGTPEPIQGSMRRSSEQQGGIIFDPPIVPPPFPTNTGQMKFGNYTLIRDAGEFGSL